MLKFVRHKVSLNKIRYIQDGFDLDLTYITPNVVAMGFPAVGVEALYRNPRPQVQKLLEKVHKDKYKVYNLCAEPKWTYSPDVFHKRVGRYPFHDHQAPPLELMGQFCKDVEEWLAKDSDNIAAVHCKAGKGRAGMMICCWLVHSKTFPTAEEAMLQYGKRRTRDGKGVTIPSQRRYVRYYENIVSYGFPEPPKIKVKKITVQTSHYASSEPGEPWIEILAGGKDRLFASKPSKVKGEDLVVDVDGIEIEGDVKVNVYDSSRAKKGKPICHFWFNTAFVNGNKLQVTRPEIDKAWNDKKFKIFQKEFDITVEFEGAAVSAIEQLKEKQTPKSPKSSSRSNKHSKKSKKHRKENSHSKTSNGKSKGTKSSSSEKETKKSESEPDTVKVEEKPKEEKVEKKEEPQSKEAKKEEKVEEKKEEKVEKKEEPQPKEEKKEEQPDTVVFISGHSLQSPQPEKKDGVVTSEEESVKAEEKPVAVDESSDSSSTTSSEESSAEEPPKAEEKPSTEEEKPAVVFAAEQEESSETESSSSEASSEEEKPVTNPTSDEKKEVSTEEQKKEEESSSEDSSDSSDSSEEL